VWSNKVAENNEILCNRSQGKSLDLIDILTPGRLHGRRLRGDWGDGPSKKFTWGDGPCIRPLNISRSSVTGYTAGRSKKNVQMVTGLANAV